MLRNFSQFLRSPASLGIPLPAPSPPAYRTPPAPCPPPQEMSGKSYNIFVSKQQLIINFYYQNCYQTSTARFKLLRRFALDFRAVSAKKKVTK